VFGGNAPSTFQPANFMKTIEPIRMRGLRTGVVNMVRCTG
jgi:hypothetical protein